MATQRLSQLQKQILRWLWVDDQRTHGGTSSSHHQKTPRSLGIHAGDG
jgi:hypothetical protein